jgi:tRNA A-37 threonylcarbamoyl transferase component Bud32
VTEEISCNVGSLHNPVCIHHDSIIRFQFISASGFFLVRFMASGSAESIAPEAVDFGVIRWGLLTPGVA